MAEDARSEALIKPFLLGRDIKRYQSPQNIKYVIFTRRGVDIKQYAAVEKYLSQFREKLTPRPKGWKGTKWNGRKPGAYRWYEIQDTVDYFAEFEKPKIIIPAIVQKASYAFDTQGHYSNDKTSIIALDDMYLLGLLNSRLLDFIVHSTASTKQGGYYEYKPMYVGKLPIRAIDATSVTDQSAHTQMITLVTQMLDLNQKLSTARDPQTHTLLQRQIEATDRQIDQLVYQLYDLTVQEIELVEAAG